MGNTLGHLSLAGIPLAFAAIGGALAGAEGAALALLVSSIVSAALTCTRDPVRGNRPRRRGS